MPGTLLESIAGWTILVLLLLILGAVIVLPFYYLAGKLFPKWRPGLWVKSLGVGLAALGLWFLIPALLRFLHYNNFI